MPLPLQRTSDSSEKGLRNAGPQLDRLASCSGRTRWSACRVMSKPNQKEIKKKPLAFGVLPETHRYRLRMARYPALALTIVN